MSKLVVIGCCLLLSITSSECIECYSCVSTEHPDCVHPEHHLQRRMCDSDGLLTTKESASVLNTDYKSIFEYAFPERAIALSCLKMVVKVSGQEVVLRGCQLPKDVQNQLDVCKKVFEIQQKTTTSVMHCSLCDVDGCNRTTPTHAAASGTCVLAMLAAVLLRTATF